jgi:hypothetical protein
MTRPNPNKIMNKFNKASFKEYFARAAGHFKTFLVFLLSVLVSLAYIAV